MAAAKLAVPDSEYSRESSTEPFQEHLYKVLVIGDFGVGESINALFTYIMIITIIISGCQFPMGQSLNMFANNFGTSG